MGRIVQLDESLSNLIAAGEVVENMASVVKELLENSLDANSDTIHIHLVEYGLKSIEVIDNGQGIEYEDLPIAFKRHATSKIRTHHDLHHIASLGFRGEALPSIAGVSHLEIESSTSSQASRKLLLKNGEIIEDSEGSLPRGTRIAVKNLFYNTPARLKHLKSEQRELSMILDYVNKLALAYPNVRFTLTHNQKTLLQTSGDGDLKKILFQIYDLEIVKNLLHFESKNAYFKVEGYLCKPVYTRSSRQHITLITNQRMIRNSRVSQAVLEGFRTYLPMQKYPIVYLSITVDPMLIDVNIHPQKLEIKFSEEMSLLTLIKNTIQETLESAELIPKIQKSIKPKDTQEKLSFEENLKFEPKSMVEETVSISEDYGQPMKRKLPNFEYIGQFSGTYLLFQDEEGFYMMDQHAAAERIRYELYSDAMSQKKEAAQTLLIPLEIHLSNQEKIAFTEHHETLENFGLKTVLTEKNSVKITAIPSWFHEGYEEVYAEYMIKYLLQEESVSAKKVIDQLAKDLACKHSIKANKYININEVVKLVNDLKQTKNPYTCPHGRPTIIQFTLSEIETMFKRINA